MSQPNRKLTYPIGSDWTLGKPTQAETGLGKIVTIMRIAEDFRRVLVADCENPDKKAEVRIKNLGNKLAEDAKNFDLSAYEPAARHARRTPKPHDTRAHAFTHSFVGRLLEELS